MPHKIPWRELRKFLDETPGWQSLVQESHPGDNDDSQGNPRGPKGYIPLQLLASGNPPPKDLEVAKSVMNDITKASMRARVVNKKVATGQAAVHLAAAQHNVAMLEAMVSAEDEVSLSEDLHDVIDWDMPGKNDESAWDQFIEGKTSQTEIFLKTAEILASRTGRTYTRPTEHERERSRPRHKYVSLRSRASSRDRWADWSERCSRASSRDRGADWSERCSSDWNERWGAWHRGREYRGGRDW